MFPLGLIKFQVREEILEEDSEKSYAGAGGPKEQAKRDAILKRVRWISKRKKKIRM